MVDDIIFHKLNSLLAHHHPVLILEILATVQLKWPRYVQRYEHLVWIIPSRKQWLHVI